MGSATGTASARARSTQSDSPRERILRCATELLAEGGPSALTLRTVGARVGLHNSSLFHHFPGKREIMAVVLGRVSESLRERLEPLAQDAPPSLERLVAVLVTLSDHYAVERSEARCAVRLLLEPELAGARGGQGATALWSWLARAQASGAIRTVNVGHAARNLLSMVLLDPVWPTTGTEESDRDRDRRRTELAAFVHGALARSA
ncbi:TetR/AcrR family transcriptional regulator [Candidatus Binatia bacterium]|jgi:AcrR family transcriptional regulator|nr:TetR/AcrR family transcriptional regulator [Candidatus Binatia bacterium]